MVVKWQMVVVQVIDRKSWTNEEAKKSNIDNRAKFWSSGIKGAHHRKQPSV